MQPQYQRVKLLPTPPTILPSCQLSGVNTSSGVGVASSCYLVSGRCLGGSPHLSTQLCQMKRAAHPQAEVYWGDWAGYQPPGLREGGRLGAQPCRHADPHGDFWKC